MIDQIQEIMDNFDFKRVHQVMTATNWKWADELPTLQNIKDTAKERMETLIEKNLYSAATGGFVATMHKNAPEPYIELQFVVTEWDCRIAQ